MPLVRYVEVGVVFFFQAEDGIRDYKVTGVQTCALPISSFVGFMLWFLLVFGLMFELPLAITLLARLGWVDAVMLRRYWKWALVGSFAIEIGRASCRERV